MSKLIVNGGRRLRGVQQIHGAKNSVLPILASAYLTRGETILHNCPMLTDVQAACAILETLGCRVDRSDDRIVLHTADADGWRIPVEQMGEMRSSIIFVGAMLARTGRAELSAPGGCDLGPRPIDLHLRALRRMGVRVEEGQGKVQCTAPCGLHGCIIDFPAVSVGATETALIASVTARGCTRILNAAREPEISDLIAYLRKCGARIYGEGTSELYVEGVSQLHGAEHTVMPDRIETATYLTAAAVTEGQLLLYRTDAGLLSPVIRCLQQAGCTIYQEPGRILLRAPHRLQGMGRIFTAPYPDFPTDAQAILMAAAAGADGETRFTENIFARRFRHVPQLCRMGAQIAVQGREAVVRGMPSLHGAAVRATDLRGGAALVIAGLQARGTTEISDIGHIDRGYEHLAQALQALGADIERTAAAPAEP